jgi:hypothetical protein
VALPVIGIVLAVGVSLLRGGRFHHAAHNDLHWLPVLVAGLVLQTLLDALAARGVVGDPGTVALLLVSEAAVLGFCIRNWYRAGMALIALGFTMNAVVILANGGMPVGADAIRAMGGDPSTAVLAGKHHLATAATALPWLGDVIPLPPVDLIVSVGDVVLVAGMIPFAHDLMTPDGPGARVGRRRARRRRQAVGAGDA